MNFELKTLTPGSIADKFQNTCLAQNVVKKQ